MSRFKTFFASFFTDETNALPQAKHDIEYQKIITPPSLTDEYADFVQSVKSEHYDEIRERLNDPKTIDMLHSVMGVAGEAGELIDAFKKYVIYGKELDLENFKEELGDLLWYIEVGAHAADTSTGECMQSNMDKLSKRYHSGSYSNEQAINRADKTEGDEVPHHNV